MGPLKGYPLGRALSLPASLFEFAGREFKSVPLGRRPFGGGCGLSGGCVDRADLCERPAEELDMEERRIEACLQHVRCGAVGEAEASGNDNSHELGGLVDGDGEGAAESWTAEFGDGGLCGIGIGEGEAVGDEGE